MPEHVRDYQVTRRILPGVEIDAESGTGRARKAAPKKLNRELRKNVGKEGKGLHTFQATGQLPEQLVWRQALYSFLNPWSAQPARVGEIVQNFAMSCASATARRRSLRASTFDAAGSSLPSSSFGIFQPGSTPSMLGSSWAMPLWQSIHVALPGSRNFEWMFAARCVCLVKSIATAE